MRTPQGQDRIQRMMKTWEGIAYWMEERGVSPQALARSTGYPEDRIERGLRGEPQPLPSYFLHACVNVFVLRSARARFFEETDDVLSDDECMAILTRPSPPSHRQGRLWGD